jgi:endoglucanase
VHPSRIAKLVFSCLLLLPATLIAQYMHTSQKEIVDGNDKPFLMHGTNLGNWLVAEGYMWNFEGGPQSAREIENLVSELLGPEKSQAFWRTWRDTYITRNDIHLIHEAGFNTIRIPMHYKFFETDSSEAFTLLDRVIEWSHKEGLYVILDMHVAPGGQTGANIDDSYGYPWLYDSPQEQAHLIAIWQRLARHYKNNPTILGYDLLNEPIPHFPALAPLNSKLEPLYKKLTVAVRDVDKHHILFLGGAQWDSNFAVFGKPFDSNTGYTFHKYWTATDVSVIQPYLDFRDKYNVPIWMGESGENKDDWIEKFTQLLNVNNIGWTYWPYKKMTNTACVVTFPPSEGWDKIVAYAKLPRGTGAVEERLKARPDQATINRAFDGLLASIQLKSGKVNAGYLKALGLNAGISIPAAISGREQEHQ